MQSRNLEEGFESEILTRHRANTARKLRVQNRGLNMANLHTGAAEIPFRLSDNKRGRCT
jgi:hypothetical protein